MDRICFQKEKIGLQLPEIKGKTIFYCVLNWGIGHATRSVPIIQHLIDNENQVILFSDGEAENLLRASFPHLNIHTLPSYKIQYKSTRFLFLTIILQSSTRGKIIKKENKAIQEYHKKYNADIIISDNRYGCYIDGKENYLITHQLKLVSNFLVEKISLFFIKNLIKPYKEIWIPDIESVKLSGNMTDVDVNVKKRWIGFPKINSIDTDMPNQEGHKNKIDLLILLSGPEPRRTELEATYLKIIPSLDRKVSFIAGNFSNKYNEFQRENLEYYSFKKYEETLQFIANADTIICRSGYSTLIDLYVLEKEKIICVPTTGQPEQEYLADYWSEKGWIKALTESELENKLKNLIKF